MINNITVFCGSSEGSDIAFGEMAGALGALLAKQQIGLVYGGAQVGLMGLIADAALKNEGVVIGVIPKFLGRKEIRHDGLTQLIIVETMHERKAKMDELCDGFIAMPGGFGTLEELFEALTWAQLALHKKPIGILNVNGYYDKLIAFLKETVQSGLLKKANLDLILVSDNADDLIKKMQAYTSQVVEKWL